MRAGSRQCGGSGRILAVSVRDKLTGQRIHVGFDGCSGLGEGMDAVTAALDFGTADIVAFGRQLFRHRKRSTVVTERRHWVGRCQDAVSFAHIWLEVMAKRLVWGGILLTLMLQIGSGSAAPNETDNDDHEAAHRALQQGQAKPLGVILELIKPQISGDIIDVEFENTNGRYIYELKIVGPDGRLHEIYVDALTAEILPHGPD